MNSHQFNSQPKEIKTNNVLVLSAAGTIRLDSPTITTKGSVTLLYKHLVGGHPVYLS